MRHELRSVTIMGLAGILSVVFLMPHTKPEKVEIKESPVVVKEVRELYEPVEVKAIEKPWYYKPTDEEIELLVRVVMSEASILPIEGKQAVAQVILNRMYSDKFPNTIEEVIYQEGQFSTADNGLPNEECYEAVAATCEYGPFPADMLYFRDSHYHTWAQDYMKIGNMYFSTEREK